MLKLYNSWKTEVAFSWVRRHKYKCSVYWSCHSFHVVLVLSKWDSKTLKSDLLKASAVQKCHSQILQETTCMHVFTPAKLKRNMFSIARLGAFEGGNSCLCSNVPSTKVQDWPGRRKHSATSTSQRSSLTILDNPDNNFCTVWYFWVVKIFRSFPLFIFFVIWAGCFQK